MIRLESTQGAFGVPQVRTGMPVRCKDSYVRTDKELLQSLP